MVRSSLRFPWLAAIALTAAACSSNPSADPQPTAAPSPTPAPARQLPAAADDFIVGVNIPWYEWGCDFGCAEAGGITANRTVIEERLRLLADNNIKYVRWWVFPGEATHIQRDSAGLPASLNPAVYTDFDTLAEIADEYDLYLQLLLFSAPSHIPASWIEDEAGREALASALQPLFERYRDNERFAVWEIINEPEWDIDAGRVDADDVRETVRTLTATIHASSNAAVTVGGANLSGLKYWQDLGLDFHAPHWYDPMGGRDTAVDVTSGDLVDRYGVTLPVIIGEFYAGEDIDLADRLQTLKDNGYAGAYAWSLFPERTQDKLEIDFTELIAPPETP